MKKILVTGGYGYVGRYVADLMLKEGYDVYITSRKPRRDDKCRVMELLDEATIKGVCEGMDAVIHLAAQDERLSKDGKHAKDALLMNAYATKLLYEDAVRAKAKRFIYFSTFHVYGKGTGNIDEETKTAPLDDYGLTHLFAEEYLKQLSGKYSVPADVIRLTNGIGSTVNENKWYFVLNDFCRSALTEGKIIIKSDGFALRDFVSLKDVARAALLLLSREAVENFQIYNVSGEKSISIRDLADKTAEIYKKRYNKEVIVEIAKKPTTKNIENLFVSSAKIRKLGWTPKLNLEDVINESFAYFEAYYGKEQ